MRARAIALVVATGLAAGAAAKDVPGDAALESASAGQAVRLRSGANGSARIVDVPLEVYVARVLAGEGEPRAVDAAQRALAIAIRTFAASNAGRHRRDGFDLCDTTHCQVLRPATPASRMAAFATAGQLLTYNGRAAHVFYSASCGGRSEAVSQVWSGAVDLPYLRSTEDDVHGEDDWWTLEVPIGRVEQALRRAGFDGRRLKDVRVERRSASGRVTQLHLSGLQPAEIAGDDFRAALGARALRSTQFTVTRAGEELRFRGRGYGHGVGMCVIGAGRRAARGETTSQILSQYYPGLRVQTLGDVSAAPIVEPVVESDARHAETPEQQLAARVRDELAHTLGITAAPEVRLEIYDSIDHFRRVTGRPWWVTAAVDGELISLPPGALLGQREALEPSVRRGVADLLVSSALADRPAWVRVGAARYYASPQRAAPSKRRVRCPSDAELTMAVSATAHRDAELRAEACFARALAKAGDWRAVR